MSMISKLVKIATDLDKCGRYEDADAITHVAKRLTKKAGPLSRHLKRTPYPTEHDKGGSHKEGSPQYGDEEEVLLGVPEYESEDDIGPGTFFTPTEEQQVAWEPAEGGYPVYRDVPLSQDDDPEAGGLAFEMQPTPGMQPLDQARRSRDLLQRYYRRRYQGETPPGEFATDEEGSFPMPPSPGREKRQINIQVTRNQPYSYRPYEGYE